MNNKFFVNVSDLAICQRCPALFAQKIHNGEKSAWKVGIKGNGEAYGSIFHQNISRPFYEAAAHRENYLHMKIARSISTGTLEEVVRKNIFMPFAAENSKNLYSGQLLAMAKAVTIWVKAMSDYFINIPSLMNDPLKNMLTVFKMPEQKLRGCYDFNVDGENKQLFIVGCYDALMFNPDRAEARLIEFKGYCKSDLTVPLSQSLIYAWLIYKMTGIIPSVEIIYLDDADKAPDVFSPKSVSTMINSGLPELFHTAFDIITLRRYPKILHDKKLCSVCKFNRTCKADIEKIFMRRRSGASLINVLVFMFAAVMITAQVFFFSENESKSMKDEREMMQVRMRLENIVETGKTLLPSYVATPMMTLPIADYETFYNNTKLSGFPKNYWNKTYYLCIHTLNYMLQEKTFDPTKWEKYKNDETYKKIFPPMGANYYLIRAYTALRTGNSLMHQVLVYKNSSSDVITRAYEEIWY